MSGMEVDIRRQENDRESIEMSLTPSNLSLKEYFTLPKPVSVTISNPSQGKIPHARNNAVMEDSKSSTERTTSPYHDLAMWIDTSISPSSSGLPDTEKSTAPPLYIPERLKDEPHSNESPNWAKAPDAPPLRSFAEHRFLQRPSSDHIRRTDWNQNYQQSASGSSAPFDTWGPDTHREQYTDIPDTRFKTPLSHIGSDQWHSETRLGSIRPPTERERSSTPAFDNFNNPGQWPTDKSKRWDHQDNQHYGRGRFDRNDPPATGSNAIEIDPRRARHSRVALNNRYSQSAAVPMDVDDNNSTNYYSPQAPPVYTHSRHDDAGVSQSLSQTNVSDDDRKNSHYDDQSAWGIKREGGEHISVESTALDSATEWNDNDTPSWGPQEEKSQANTQYNAVPKDAQVSRSHSRDEPSISGSDRYSRTAAAMYASQSHSNSRSESKFSSAQYIAPNTSHRREPPNAMEDNSQPRKPQQADPTIVSATVYPEPNLEEDDLGANYMGIPTVNYAVWGIDASQSTTPAPTASNPLQSGTGWGRGQNPPAVHSRRDEGYGVRDRLDNRSSNNDRYHGGDGREYRENRMDGRARQQWHGANNSEGFADGRWVSMHHDSSSQSDWAYKGPPAHDDRFSKGPQGGGGGWNGERYEEYEPRAQPWARN